jgi:excisionase family DNA binding protein
MQNIILSPISIDDLEALIRKCVKEEAGSSEVSGDSEAKEDEFLTTQEAADFLKVSLVSIHTWKRERGLPYYRVGRSIRFLKRDLIGFAEVRGRKNV